MSKMIQHGQDKQKKWETVWHLHIINTNPLVTLFFTFHYYKFIVLSNRVLGIVQNRKDF